MSAQLMGEQPDIDTEWERLGHGEGFPLLR